MKGVLYIVSTPIGNLSDITQRAKHILSTVDFIVAEDTRRTSILLSHLGIKKPLFSFYYPKEMEKVSIILEKLKRGENGALVTDAGTPLVSDPGFVLVEKAIKEGIKIVPIPGPSAVLAALVASGIPCVPFSFWGYIPKGSERKRFFEDLKNRYETLVFFESPKRLKESLKDMLFIFGDRRCCVAREITKVHEEFLRGTISEIIGVLPENIKGEITIVLEGCRDKAQEPEWMDKATLLLSEGFSLKDVSRIISLIFEVPKNEVYKYLIGSHEVRS